MKYGTLFVLIITLLAAAAFPAMPVGHAQAPGGVPTTPTTLQIPADWVTYQDVNGAWSVKHPANWTVDESEPNAVTFQADAMNKLEISIETEPFPLPLDNWLSLDLLAQGAVESMADSPDMKLVEKYRQGPMGSLR